MLVFQRLTRHCDDGQQYESRRSLHVPDLSLQQAPPALEMGVQMLWPNEGMQVLSSSAKKLRLRAIKKSCARFLHAARRKGWKQSPFCNPRKTRVTSTSRSAAASRLTARWTTARPAGFWGNFDFDSAFIECSEDTDCHFERSSGRCWCRACLHLAPNWTVKLEYNYIGYGSGQRQFNLFRAC